MLTFTKQMPHPKAEGWVTTEYPTLTGAMSAYPYSPTLQALYTFKTPFEEMVCGAVRQGNTLWVPRESAPYAKGPEDFRTDAKIPAVPGAFVARHEQEDRCQESLGLLKRGVSHIFEAPTGWGKTVVGGAIACRFGRRTLIVVTKDDLVHQWRHSLIHILGVSPLEIGHVQQDTQEWKDKRIVIGMVQSLIIPDKYPAALFRYFGLLILDECHVMAADCFVRVCQNFAAKYRLGFSATPKRKDGKTQLLHWHVGPVLVKGQVLAMHPKVLVRQTGWRIPRQKHSNAPIPYKPGRMMTVNKAMASNNLRNLEIVNFTVQSYQKGRTVLIMSELRDYHLHRLFQMLTGEGVPGQDIGYYVGGMKKHELDATKRCKVVLATYSMCATGTDCPVWDTLVMATPRADVKQAIGRVLRHLDGKRQPVILDLVDTDSIFQNFHLARCKTYYELGSEIVKIHSG